VLISFAGRPSISGTNDQGIEAYALRLSMAGVIDPDKCTHDVATQNMVVLLVKSSPGMWETTQIEVDSSDGALKWSDVQSPPGIVREEPTHLDASTIAHLRSVLKPEHLSQQPTSSPALNSGEVSTCAPDATTQRYDVTKSECEERDPVTFATGICSNSLNVRLPSNSALLTNSLLLDLD
jgi:hypothetical protein